MSHPFFFISIDFSAAIHLLYCEGENAETCKNVVQTTVVGSDIMGANRSI